MLDKAFNWIHSDLNVFTILGCIFETIRSPEQAEVQSVAVDFELNSYLCRLTFWESGNGHIEVIEIDSEQTFMDEGFDLERELGKNEPFKELAGKLHK